MNDPASDAGYKLRAPTDGMIHQQGRWPGGYPALRLKNTRAARQGVLHTFHGRHLAIRLDGSQAAYGGNSVMTVRTGQAGFDADTR